jgi:hypothetical protein
MRLHGSDIPRPRRTSQSTGAEMPNLRGYAAETAITASRRCARSARSAAPLPPARARG